MTKVIVIGGVAGGATFASQLRRLDSECEITLFEKDRDVTFANCGLPIISATSSRSAQNCCILLPNNLKKKKNVTAKVFHEVIHVDPNHQTVTVKDLKIILLFTENYDYLVMSPGCRANRLP